MDRAREYAFLLYAVAIAAAYAIVHDQITVTISPEYFVYGKGVTASSLRWGAAWVAARASLAMGLFAGTALLVANAPRGPRTPGRLAYSHLARLALLPLATAAVGAAIAGAVNAHARMGEATALSLGVPVENVPRFVTVWGMHFGSYAGALFGTAVSTARVWGRRRSVVPAE
jgi:hypothetical protein